MPSLKHTVKSGQPQMVFFCFLGPAHPKDPASRKETQAFCHIALLFRERCYSAAPDLPSLPYLLFSAALDQSLCVNLTHLSTFHLVVCPARP